MTVQHIVTLLHASPLYLAAHGARTCWNSHGKSDTKECQLQAMQEAILDDNYGFTADHITGSADMDLIDRVGNKFRHASILEHLNYTFYIEGISRACLQELSRHRHTSPSVKSSRYTLKELNSEASFINNDDENILQSYDRACQYVVFTGDDSIDYSILGALEALRVLVRLGKPNDLTKYAMPEAYKVTEQLTINARSLQNFLSLRSDKSALWEIQQLATSLYEALPTEHQYLFTHCMKEV